MSVSGIDVSDYQNPVDWSAVAGGGIKFAFTKATEGATFVAETFARNWAEAQRVGITRGAYHFFRPEVDPQTQAEHFLNTVKPGPADLPPVLDIEVRDGVDPVSLLTRVQQWLDGVEHATARKSILYMSPSFWEDLGSPRGFSDHPLWIADYGVSSPAIPRGWSTFTFWQYTSGGGVAGIGGMVDLNVFNGSPENLTAFVASGQVPTTAVVTQELILEGDVGPDVQEIQRLLTARGFDPGGTDGVFGPQTKAAVIAFQGKNNLAVDGVVGSQTVVKLRA